MSNTFNITKNGDVINIPITNFKRLDGNSGVAPNVKVTFTFEPGIAFSNFSKNLGTFASNTLVWTIGDLSQGVNPTATLSVQVTDIAQAIAQPGQNNKLGIKITATATADGDSMPGNNQYFYYLLREDCIASQPNNYYQPTTGSLTPPNACLVDDELAGVTGNVLLNDHFNCDGCGSIELELVPASENNVVINAFDKVNGNYSVTPINGTLAWSFQYRAYCRQCPNGSDYGPFAPATVSGPALFDCTTVGGCISSSSILVADYVVSNDGGNLAFFASGSPLANWTAPLNPVTGAVVGVKFENGQGYYKYNGSVWQLVYFTPEENVYLSRSVASAGSATSRDYLIYLSGAGGAYNFTLPDPSTLPQYKVTYKFILVDNTNPVTLDTDAGNISGAATYTLTNAYEATTIIHDGTNYFLI